MDGLNNTFEDGDAYYQAGASFYEDALATPEGLLVTVFQFNAVGVGAGTLIEMPYTFGEHTATEVFGYVVADDVLDEAVPGEVTVVEPTKTATSFKLTAKKD